MKRARYAAILLLVTAGCTGPQQGATPGIVNGLQAPGSAPHTGMNSESAVLIPAGNPCKAAYLASFVVSNDEEALTGTEEADAKNDWCAAAPASIPGEISAAIRQLGGLHAQLSRFLGLAPGRLFGAGIRAGIVKVSSGVLGSFHHALKRRVYAGVYSDWKGEPLNGGAYVHELGHYLAFQEGGALPSALGVLNDSPYFSETFGDFLALGVTGRIFSDLAQLPACWERARIIGSYQTYGFPRDFFDERYGSSKIQSCCAFLRQHPALQDPHTQEICSGLPSGAENFKINRRVEFTAEQYELDPAAFDIHQLGIPVNSFLRALERETGRSSASAFLIALADLSTRSLGDAYQCTGDQTVQVRVPSLETFFTAFRARLPAPHRAVYDALWIRHQMDKGMAIARLDALRQIAPIAAIKSVANCDRFTPSCRPKCLKL